MATGIRSQDLRLSLWTLLLLVALCTPPSTTVAGFTIVPQFRYQCVFIETNPSFIANSRFLPKGHRRPLHSSSSSSSRDEGGENIPSQSRFEGNRRAPTPQEISVMDDMITKLADSKPYELPAAVSKAIRVCSSPRFFLRIAERTDMADTALEKEKLSALAENLLRTVEAVVSTTEDRLDERAVDVENVVKAAAEPESGEFLVPLTPERIAAMRDALGGLDRASLDEGFLSTVDAWMNKSMQDGMDGMVTILQRVLQIYAGTEIARARDILQAQVGAALTGSNQEEVEESMMAAEEKDGGPRPASVLFEDLLSIDTDLWDSELKARLANGEGGVTPKALLGEVQRTIEGVVLGLENGSMAQRVQAEYLRELVSRIEAIENSM